MLFEVFENWGMFWHGDISHVWIEYIAICDMLVMKWLFSREYIHRIKSKQSKYEKNIFFKSIIFKNVSIFKNCLFQNKIETNIK